jgi:hypothetical protein
MKNYVKLFICLLFAAGFSSCSDDDSGSNGSSSGKAVNFNGSGIEFVDVTISQDNNSLLEVIFTTMNNVSVVLYLKKATDDFQDPSDAAITYTADGGEYNIAAYPDKTVRGYVNSVADTYMLKSGTVKVKLNEGGKQDFTFNLVTVNGDDETSFKGTASVTMSAGW